MNSRFPVVCFLALSTVLSSLFATDPRAPKDDPPKVLCPVEIKAFNVFSSEREQRALAQVKQLAQGSLVQVFEILKKYDVRQGSALASAEISKILSAKRPDPMGKIQQLQQTISELRSQGALGAKTGELLTTLGKRMRKAARRGDNGGFLRHMRVFVESIPFAGTKVANQVDAGKPVNRVIGEMRSDIDSQLGANDRTNDKLQQFIGEMSSAKEKQRVYAMTLKELGLLLTQASEQPDLGEEDQRFLKCLAVNVLEESRTNFDIALALGEGRQNAYEITIGLANASRTLRREAATGLVNLSVVSVNAEGMDATIQTLESASIIRKTSAKAQKLLADAMLRAAKLNAELQKDSSADKLVVAARAALEEAGRNPRGNGA